MDARELKASYKLLAASYAQNQEVRGVAEQIRQVRLERLRGLQVGHHARLAQIWGFAIAVAALTLALADLTAWKPWLAVVLVVATVAMLHRRLQHEWEDSRLTQGGLDKAITQIEREARDSHVARRYMQATTYGNLCFAADEIAKLDPDDGSYVAARDHWRKQVSGLLTRLDEDERSGRFTDDESALQTIRSRCAAVIEDL